MMKIFATATTTALNSNNIASEFEIIQLFWQLAFVENVALLLLLFILASRDIVFEFSVAFILLIVIFICRLLLMQ